MNGQDFSDTVKLGLVLLIMVFTFGTGMLVYTQLQRSANDYIMSKQNQINGADMETLVDLCTVGKVNGATMYTAITQYGTELAGIVWQDTSGNTEVYGSNIGCTGTVSDFLKLLNDNGYDTMYNVFRSEPVSGVDYQPQTMFLGVKEAT